MKKKYNVLEKHKPPWAAVRLMHHGMHHQSNITLVRRENTLSHAEASLGAVDDSRFELSLAAALPRVLKKTRDRNPDLIANPMCGSVEGFRARSQSDEHFQICK